MQGALLYKVSTVCKPRTYLSMEQVAENQPSVLRTNLATIVPTFDGAGLLKLPKYPMNWGSRACIAIQWTVLFFVCTAQVHHDPCSRVRYLNT